MIRAVQAARVAALAGRRIDQPGSPAARFPLGNIERVERDLSQVLSEERVSVLVSSAANGVDLLAQSAAQKLNIRSVIIIPFSPSQFKDSSVTDRPGSWGALFDRLVDQARRNGDLVVLNHAAGEAAYRAATESIIGEAAHLAAPQRPIAIVGWEGSARTGNDATADFVELADKRGFERREVITC